MRRALLAVVAIAWAIACAGAGARSATAADTRVALVIGLDAYENAPTLLNALNDARAVSAALKRLGFAVDESYNANHRRMGQVIRDFGQKAQNADIAVIYFAGHGVQINGENYLLPVDAKLTRERDVNYEAYALPLLLAEIAQSRKLGIIVLDSCRDNPFRERLARAALPGRGVSVRAGLARVDDVPSDTFVAMATRADALAEDGSGSNSPFSKAFLEQLEVPGLELSLFFRGVRDSVLKATNGRQEPYFFGSLGAEPFYFNPKRPNRPPVLVAPRMHEVLSTEGPKPLGLAEPSDPDGDEVTARVTAVPRGGAVRLGSHMVRAGEILRSADLPHLEFTWDGRTLGEVGLFGLVVTDPQGASAVAQVSLYVALGNRPPSVFPVQSVEVALAPLGLYPPTDPDGDPVAVHVLSVPGRGRIYSGAQILRAGDILPAADLAALTYAPEGPGEGGAFEYEADDGRGGRASARVALSAVAPKPISPPGPVGAEVEGRPERNAPNRRALLEWAGPDRRAEAARPPAAQPAPLPSLPAQSAPGPSLAAPSLPAPTVPRADPPAPASPELLVSPPPASAPVDAGSGPSLRAAALPGIDRTAHLASTPPAAAPHRALPTPRLSSPDLQTADFQPFRDCDECPEIVRVPAGTFIMGSARGDASEQPTHPVRIVAPFAIGRTEVTVEQWDACVRAGGCKGIPAVTKARPATPVFNASWDDARDYAGWLARITSRPYRLPTEAEWEYAARARTETPFWWGSDGRIARANCKGCQGPYDSKLPADAGSFPPNPFGLHDVSGGVAEWVADCWVKNHEGAPGDGSARVLPGCQMRVVRGGSWRNDVSYLGSASRQGYDANVRYIAHGFRVARDLR